MGMPTPSSLTSGRRVRKRTIDFLRRIFLEEEFLFPPMKTDLAIPIMVLRHLIETGEMPDGRVCRQA